MGIYIGVGGWVFDEWRDNFYPKGLSQKKELEYAAGKLTAIEVNGTYYGSQKPESFRRWHDETPKGFKFTLKGPRFATNRRVLAEAGPSIQKFLESGITELKSKLGPLNWQFMATKKFDAADFEAFLKLLPKKHAGIALRQQIEDDTDRLTTLPWELFGEQRSVEFAERLEPPCEALLRRVDATAGPNYQPGSRVRA